MFQNSRDTFSVGSTNSLVWPAALAFATVAGSLAVAGAMPFVALATLAAVTMPRNLALLTLVMAWLVNQVIGFGFIGFPHTASTVIWGLVILVSSLVALMVVRRFAVTARISLRLVAAFAAAFVSYEVTLFTISTFAGEVCPVTSSVIAAVLLNDSLWFAGLLTVHGVLRQAAPRLFSAERQA